MRQLIPLLLAFGCVADLAAQVKDGAGRRQNVLFLFADDQRPDTIHALGNAVIQTPNLDALANRGMVFENAYCMGSTSGAVCNPSRHQMLSGMSLFRYKQRRPTHEGTFGDVFTKAGYETFHLSKRGNTAHKYHKGFTHSSYLNDRKERTSGHHGREVANRAVAFLKDGWKQDKPLFMYLGFAGPHDPRVAAPEWMKRYKREEIPLPPNYKPFHPVDNGELWVRDERLEKWPRTQDAVRKHLHDYYACITSIDHHIGRIIRTLKDLGQFENTIIIFSADHGLAIGSHGLFGKQNLYEHSIGAPLIFAGPGIPKGRSQALAYLFDIFPTTAELAGVPHPEDLDGRSLVPVIRGEEETVRGAALFAYKGVQRAIRKGPFKLHRFPKINRSMLFNIAEDPHELKDLAGDRGHRVVVRQLMAIMKQAQRFYGDEAPLSVEQPGRADLDAKFFESPPKRKQRKNRRGKNNAKTGKNKKQG